MKWLLIGRQQYSENTSEYGYGDYPIQICYIMLVVEADTVRKAQNAAKKVIPTLRFGGMFGPALVPATDENLALYSKVDNRLHGLALERHTRSLATLLMIGML